MRQVKFKDTMTKRPVHKQTHRTAQNTKNNNKKLMKGKALRKHSLHEKTAASVLLKLFISGNE